MPPDSDHDQSAENRATLQLAIYILTFVLVSSLLLAVNTWMIFSLSQGTAKLLPQVPGLSILVQLVVFIGPMVLLYLEWFAWDVVFAHGPQTRKGRSS
jgi:hypothetical protein